MHIGRIGGIEPAATEYYYRGLIEGHARSNTRQLTIAHADSRELVHNLAHDDAGRQAEAFVRWSAAWRRGHALPPSRRCVGTSASVDPQRHPRDRRGDRTDEPEDARHPRHQDRHGEQALWWNFLGDYCAARGRGAEPAHANYVAMAMQGRVTHAQRRAFLSIGQYLCRVRGAEAVVLGGTDLYPAFEGQDCGFPVIDCAEIHIEALY